jgi:hypothetical protein
MISYIGKFDINMLTEDTIVTFDYISDEEYELEITKCIFIRNKKEE